MKIQLIIRRLTAVVVAVLCAVGGTVSAQNAQHTTDTVYYSVFGCDSFLLAANNTVYYHDTVVEIQHRAADQGVVYIAQLDIYQISIGTSYSVMDTVQAAVCPNALPYAYRSNFYTMPGNYWIPTSTVRGCDSAMTLLQLQVFDIQNDTVNLTMCYNQQVVYYEDIPFYAPGTYSAPMGTDTNGCPMAQIFIVTQYPFQTDTVNVEVCQTALPYSYRGMQFDATGSYQVPYTDEHGCPAMDLLVLTVRPGSMAQTSAVAYVCASDLPYEYGGQYFNTSGSYYISFYNQYGCDSVLVNLDLHVVQPATDQVSVTLCPSEFPYAYDSVHVFTQPGQYYINDNPDTLCYQYTLLTLNAYPALNDTAYICTADSSFSFHDSVFTASTIYTFVDTNAYGCADYHTLDLTLNHHLLYDTVYATVCQSEVPYEFYGTNCFVSGAYNHTLQNQKGCDSAVVTLQLTVTPNVTYTQSVVISRNSLPYIFHDSAYTTTGTYTVVSPATAVGECDTFYVLNLTVLPVYNTMLDTTVCDNESVEFLGETITTAGIHKFTYHFADYDSVVSLNVHHNPTYIDQTVNVSVGEYDLPYLFADTAYSTAGYHERTLTTVLGCDSVVSIYLTVIPAVTNNDTIPVEVCSNDLPVLLYDSLLSAAGTYRYLVRTADNHYDSVFFVRLTVKESPTLLLADTVYMCTGNTATLTAQSTGSVYLWNNGQTLPSITVNLPGTYSVTVSNAFECSASDTVQVIQVDLPNAQIQGGTTVCQGSSMVLRATGGTTYLWDNGSTSDSITVSPTENTTYYVTVTNEYGCSQSLNVTVVVNPLPVITLMGPSDICAGSNALIVASGANSYVWNTGATSDRITVNTQDIYTVTGTDANGCQNTASMPLTVHPLPNIKINGRTTLCPGGNTTITATGASTYEWTSGELTQSMTVSYAGTYTVIGTDQYGCSASKSVTITQAQVTGTITGNRYFCHGQSTTLTVSDNGDNTYHWFDGSTSNSININSPGQYSVTLTNAAGCQNTLTAIVSEYNTPAPTISGNLTICANQTTTLRASGGSSYVWDNGSTQPLISVNATGTYTVTATDQYGCTATASASVIVNPEPVVNILGQNTICQGSSVTLTAIASANTYNWSTGQNTASITVTPMVSTNYTVMVTDENGCSGSASKLVTVNTLPSAYLTGPSAICQGDTATYTVSGGIAYHWNTGQYSNSIQATTAGVYSVEVYGSNGCSVTLQKSLMVNALPIATVTETAEICRGQQAALSADAPTGSTFLWSTGSHQSHITVSDAGRYTVTITNANQCSNVYSSEVTVHELPMVTITGNNEICQGQSALLTASGDDASQYVWSTGDHNAFTTVSTSGQVSVTATNGYGCSASASRGVVVHELPVPQISGNLTICKGSSTTLTAIGGSSYRWDTGDSTNSIIVSPMSNHSYVVTATNIYGCVASTAATVAVNELPEITLSGNRTICAGTSTTITASGASTYVWSTGAHTSSLVINNTGTYYVTATSVQNCSKTDSVFVKMNPNPQILISGIDRVCAGGTSTLTATGANTYVWNTGDVLPTITVAPALSTTYTVTGYDTNGCFTTAQKMVNVEELPTVQILGERTICQGNSTVLTATGGSSYAWSTGSTSASIAVFPNMTNSYTVTVFSSFGCSATATATVTVNVLPSIFFSGSPSFCQGQSTTITASGGNSYLWNTGANTPTITVSTPGVYHVNVTNSQNCMRSDSVVVTMWENPTVSIDGASLICDGTATQLTASGADSYSWNTGENGAVITVMPTETTTYSVTGTDVNGCQASVSKVVNVEELPEVYISGILAICHGTSTTLTASTASAYLWSTGDTTASITVSEQGAYTVTASSANGCQSMASATVEDNPLPTFTISGDGFFCANSSATLSVIGDNTYLWSTGDTTTQITVTQGGAYSVTATNVYGCTKSLNTVVTQLPIPMLYIQGANSLCQGDSTMLFASSDATQFLWSTGETTPFIEVVPDNTTYSVTATGTNGCTTTAQHQVTSLPAYTIAVTGSVCQGQSYTGNGFETPVMDTAGTYIFTHHLQTAAGCDSIINLTLTVNPLPILDTITGWPNITQYGNSIYFVDEDNCSDVINYEWRISNLNWHLQNQNTSRVTVEVNTNGTAVLTVRGVNNCGYTEQAINLTCNVGIEDHPAQTLVKLYPNPVHQSLYIDLDNAFEVAKVALYNESGRLVYQSDCNDTHLEIDCTRFASGHYTVMFLDEKGRRVESRKIIVNNQ